MHISTVYKFNVNRKDRCSGSDSNWKRQIGVVCRNEVRIRLRRHVYTCTFTYIRIVCVCACARVYTRVYTCMRVSGAITVNEGARNARPPSFQMQITREVALCLHFRSLRAIRLGGVCSCERIRVPRTYELLKPTSTSTSFGLYIGAILNGNATPSGPRPTEQIVKLGDPLRAKF